MRNNTTIYTCLFFAALLVVASLSSPARSAQTLTGKPKVETGAVALSVTTDLFTRANIVVERKGAKGLSVITVNSRKKNPFKLESEPLPAPISKEGVYPIGGSIYRTYVAYKELPPGKYVIARMWINNDWYNNAWSSEEQIDFEIIPGKTTYIGNFDWRLLFGKSAMVKLEYPQGWKFSISNEEERDIKWIAADYPAAVDFIVSVPTTWNRDRWF